MKKAPYLLLWTRRNDVTVVFICMILCYISVVSSQYVSGAYGGKNGVILCIKAAYLAERNLIIVIKDVQKYLQDFQLPLPEIIWNANSCTTARTESCNSP